MRVRQGTIKRLSFFFIAGMFMLLVAANPAGADRAARRYKLTTCEQRCRELFWQGRVKAQQRKNEKARERGLIICENHFQGCVRRCGEYYR